MKSLLYSEKPLMLTHYAEKNNGYFDFKQLKLCAHIKISYKRV